MNNHIYFQKTTELFIVIIIISILVVLYFQNCGKQALSFAYATNCLGKGFLETKTDELVFLAINGRFPKNNEEGLKINNHKEYKDYNLNKIKIIDGAINFTFKDENKILTLRPGSVINSKNDFISWFAGKAELRKEFFISGKDQTNIKESNIPKSGK